MSLPVPYTGFKPVAFIDYENIGQLSKLNFHHYSHIMLFVGAKQRQVDVPLGYDHPLVMTLVKIQKRAKNSLRSHLTYYLGLLDSRLDKKVVFEVISSDKGVESLLSHLINNGRRCFQTNLNGVKKPSQSQIGG